MQTRLKVGEFATLRNDKMAEHGFKKGDHVFITADGFVPDSKTNPFKYRLVFVAAKLVDGHIQTEQGYSMYGENLKIATAKDAKRLNMIKEEDFGGQAEAQQAQPQGA